VAVPTQPSWDSVAQPQAQPWQAAFNQLIGAPMPQQPSTAWAAPSAMTPQGLTQAQTGNWAIPQMPQAVASPMAAQISSPPVTQAYSPSPVEVAQWAQQAAAAQIAQQQAAAPAADGYLSSISDESLEVLSHFGAETPAKLNAYSIQVEDALLESLGQQQQQSQVIAEQRDYIERVQAVLQAASADREAMMTILTDPATLSDYTLKFFSEDGPYPVQTPAEAAQAALAQGMVQAGETLMPRAENPRMDPYGEALARCPTPLPAPTARWAIPGPSSPS
jgi:hypothetical protein